MARNIKNTQPKNIYAEMLESLPVPERLSPDNIAAMLEASKAQDTERSRIQVAVAPDIVINNETEKSASKPNRKKGYAAYRTVASLAACAVMALGLVKYFDTGKTALTETTVKGSAYADNYDELHKTFRKYYVDDEEKKTLDSAMAQIEHSYIDSQTESIKDKVSVAQPEPEKEPVSTQASEKDPEPTVTEPASETPSASENNYSEVRLPEMGEREEENVIVAGNKIFVRDGSTVKVILCTNGQPEYIGDAVPECNVFETKTLEKIFAVGDRLAAVYTVVNEEPLSVPAFESSGMSTVGEVLGSIYPTEMETVRTESVEVTVYDIIPDGTISSVSTTSYKGRLVDVRESGGYVYVVTEYSNYRNSPLVGVEDLESYVPSYTVNYEKRFIEPENILIPEYMATTDYTVISGIAVCMPDIKITAQAVLGTEGKVIATDKGVYVFGYSDNDGSETTVCERFSLSLGAASFEGSAYFDGVAAANGIYENNGVIYVVTLRNGETGFVTSVNALTPELERISLVDCPAAMKDITFEGSKVFMSNLSDGYAIDFTDCERPVLIDFTDDIDLTASLVSFGDGYVTLTMNESGGLILSKIVPTEEGLRTAAEITVFASGASSKALADNSVLYCDPANGYVGVPYGYFDGYDYCYRYVLFKLTDKGFETIGQIETHEAEESFELGRAYLSNGSLYIVSEGRIYSTALSASGLSITGSAELIESSYSGHTSW